MKRITILGATGSIGKSTLKVIAAHPLKFEVFALTAKSNAKDLFQQCLAFNPYFAVLIDSNEAIGIQQKIKAAGLRTELLIGVESLEVVASHPEVDYVMAAIVGAAGLLPTLAAAKAGKRILLANKESLVMSGQLFMDTVRKHQATLLPVDSEHNAIFQCLPIGYLTGTTPSWVENLILTASGGPFRTWPINDFERITVDQAIAHPTWKMGPKISVDCATLMNKAFEVIEAYWLFNLDSEQIQVMIHPESCIHSFVCYQDGSILAQLGSPDMQTPISYTLSWPTRLSMPTKKLNLLDLAKLTFEPVDPVRFPGLNLAYQSLKAGGSTSTLLNAANEVAVAEFLSNKIKYTEIIPIINEVLDKMPVEPIETIEAVLDVDQRARRLAKQIGNKVAN